MILVQPEPDLERGFRKMEGHIAAYEESIKTSVSVNEAAELELSDI
jgi:hypothetical protein